jgi:hypothetical protein
VAARYWHDGAVLIRQKSSTINANPYTVANTRHLNQTGPAASTRRTIGTSERRTARARSLSVRYADACSHSGRSHQWKNTRRRPGGGIRPHIGAVLIRCQATNLRHAGLALVGWSLVAPAQAPTQGTVRAFPSPTVGVWYTYGSKEQCEQDRDFVQRGPIIGPQMKSARCIPSMPTH